MPHPGLDSTQAAPLSAAASPKMRRLWSFAPAYRCLASEVHLKALTLCTPRPLPQTLWGRVASTRHRTHIHTTHCFVASQDIWQDQHIASASCTAPGAPRVGSGWQGAGDNMYKGRKDDPDLIAKGARQAGQLRPVLLGTHDMRAGSAHSQVQPAQVKGCRHGGPPSCWLQRPGECVRTQTSMQSRSRTLVALLQKSLEAGRMLHPKWADCAMMNTPDLIHMVDTMHRC